MLSICPTFSSSESFFSVCAAQRRPSLVSCAGPGLEYCSAAKHGMAARQNNRIFRRTEFMMEDTITEEYKSCRKLRRRPEDFILTFHRCASDCGKAGRRCDARSEFC